MMLLLSMVCPLFILVAYADPAPPEWPDAYIIGSLETWYIFVNDTKIPAGVNKAYWYYDYTNARMRYDHEKGQFDNFCHMNVNEAVSCSLIFDPSGVMFVNYPDMDYCCQLCPVGAYCTVLKPTWLKGATYNGTRTITARECNVWNITGAVATDYWAQDDNNTPCAYYEDVST